VQPRVLAETEVVTRHMTIVNMKEGTDSVIIEDVGDEREHLERNGAKNDGKEHLSRSIGCRSQMATNFVPCWALHCKINLANGRYPRPGGRRFSCTFDWHMQMRSLSRRIYSHRFYIGSRRSDLASC
jgi:hypothetical protein